MANLKVAALGLSLFTLSAGGAFAQGAMMNHDAMAKPMSKHDMKMMKMHSDMMHDDGMMKH